MEDQAFLSLNVMSVILRPCQPIKSNGNGEMGDGKCVETVVYVCSLDHKCYFSSQNIKYIYESMLT